MIALAEPTVSERLPRPLEFVLPPELEATEPVEARGLERDQVRLMVSTSARDPVSHSTFRKLPDFLRAGDVLVVNRSATRNAALHAVRADGTLIELHLSTHQTGMRWAVELRRLEGGANKPLFDGRPGEALTLPAGASARLIEPYRGSRRLWLADVDLGGSADPYLARHGFPIRYGYVKRRWPSSFYQTLFALEMGSAEMPSAGRAFTPRVLAELEAAGVRIAPLVLHTGVASLEEGEDPYPERFRVPEETARAVNQAEGRVVAVGTTVVRALESACDEDGRVHAAEGWTERLITPESEVRVVDGLLTGLHESKATHLAMLEALAGPEHLDVAYRAALERGYLWHEFGDLHLILPDRRG
jgi:S-adenosylmethionine:tRNA ribosyltransferase-isomerase